MICFTCDKFIKKGHGKNIYWYAGEWRYYCFPCLRLNYCKQKIAERNKNYFSLVVIPTLILSALTYYVTVRWINGNEKFYFSWLALFLGFLPMVGAVILWQWKIKPNLTRLNKREQEPVLKEQTRIRQLENFIYQFKKGKEFCHCWKCLVSESQRIKSR